MGIFLAVLGGMFFANACPHFIKGVCGERFKTPFARGEKNKQSANPGTSSPAVNILWAFCNWLISFGLGFAVNTLQDDGNLLIQLAPFAVGFFLFSLASAKLFDNGRGNGEKRITGEGSNNA